MNEKLLPPPSSSSEDVTSSLWGRLLSPPLSPSLRRLPLAATSVAVGASTCVWPSICLTAGEAALQRGKNNQQPLDWFFPTQTHSRLRRNSAVPSASSVNKNLLEKLNSIVESFTAICNNVFISQIKFADNLTVKTATFMVNTITKNCEIFFFFADHQQRESDLRVKACFCLVNVTSRID